MRSRNPPDRAVPDRAQILTKAGELVGSTSAFLVAAVSATIAAARENSLRAGR
jgi:hypothetical protein